METAGLLRTRNRIVKRGRTPVTARTPRRMTGCRGNGGGA